MFMLASENGSNLPHVAIVDIVNRTLYRNTSTQAAKSKIEYRMNVHPCGTPTESQRYPGTVRKRRRNCNLLEEDVAIYIVDCRCLDDDVIKWKHFLCYCPFCGEFTGDR